MSHNVIVVLKEDNPAFVLKKATSAEMYAVNKTASLMGHVDLAGPKGTSSVVGISAFVSGRPLADEVIVGAIVPYNFTLTLANCVAKALVAGDSENTFIIKKNDVQVGTVVFPAGSTSGTISFSDLEFLKNDFITIHAPSVPDGSLSDLTFLLVY